MDFSQVIQNRYSVRTYKPDPIPEEMLNQVLEAARLAPTAANRQPFQFIIIHTQGKEDELGKIYHRDWFMKAPIIIAACLVDSQAWLRASDGFNAGLIDVAIAVDHLTLAATNLGLGTCWICNFNINYARQLFGIPEGIELVALVPIGFPIDQPVVKKRKALSELIRYEKW